MLMPRVIIHHSVNDFEHWKKGYVANEPDRKASGFTKSRVFKKIDDPNHVTVQLDCNDLEAAKTFMQSERLADTMREAGVASVPIVYFLNDGETFEN